MTVNLKFSSYILNSDRIAVVELGTVPEFRRRQDPGQDAECRQRQVLGLVDLELGRRAEPGHQRGRDQGPLQHPGRDERRREVGLRGLQDLEQDFAVVSSRNHVQVPGADQETSQGYRRPDHHRAGKNSIQTFGLGYDLVLFRERHWLMPRETS